MGKDMSDFNKTEELLHWRKKEYNTNEFYTKEACYEVVNSFEALQAENERLREALENIKQLANVMNVPKAPDGYKGIFEIAQSALQNQPDKTTDNQNP